MALPLQASTITAVRPRKHWGAACCAGAGRRSNSLQNGLDRRRRTFWSSGRWYAVEPQGPSVETSGESAGFGP
jgi:hypothetical protein